MQYSIVAYWRSMSFSGEKRGCKNDWWGAGLIFGKKTITSPVLSTIFHKFLGSVAEDISRILLFLVYIYLHVFVSVCVNYFNFVLVC